MRGRVPIALAVGLLAVLLAALAGRSTRAHHSRVISSSELLGARANANALLGHSDSGEADATAAAAVDYENRAYPADSIDFSQTLGAIAAGKAVQARGATSPKKWTQVGDGTVNVDTFGTQSFQRPTQWSGRITALAVDYKHCNGASCHLYIGAAGGGVWGTNNALASTPNWHELNTGLDSLSIGALTIDPTDPTGNTLYVGTGEPNGSSENEAGLGLYKSTDGGNHWTLVSGSVAVSKDRGIGVVSIDPANPSHILIGTDVARHGASATFGGRFTPPNAPKVGLYESTNGGQSFSLTLSRATDSVNPNSANGSDFFRGGVTDLEWDPNAAGVFYVSMTDYGLFKGSTATPGAFAQIYTGVPDPAGLGIRYQTAVTDLGNGKTRIYLGVGSNEVRTGSPARLTSASTLWRTDNAAATASNADWTNLSSSTDGTPGFSSFDYCRTQCSYDMPVASPPGQPDEVWIGGATQYQELPTRALRYRSNGRAVMRSTNAGVQFMDQTGDARHVWESIHPDIHEFAFAPGGVTFIGSDGGLTRTSGNYVDFSSDCNDRNGLTGVNLQDCQTWLSSIPERLITMNAGLPTLQLQDVAVDPTDPYNDLITGTQDNGSPFFDGKNGWGMNVLGDGAPPAIDKDGVIHYHQYSGEGIDVNFNGVTSGDWIWIGDPLLFSPEGAAIFYGSLIADPVVSQTAFAGLQHVWRTQTAGNADKQFLIDHCNTNFGDKAGTSPTSGCGDWVPLGGAAGDLTAGPDSDKGNGVSGFISAQARADDAHTMWVGTRRGRLFISQNIDAAAAAVTFTRLDTPAQPRRFVSGISVDGNDPLHAVVSFSGFSAYTPGQPGHVFDVKINATTHAVTWTDISNDLGDQPVLDVALDSATGDVYAATDFGVDRLVAGSTSWIPAAGDLPKTAVYALTLVAGKNPGDRLLYAATHGRGAWRTDLPSVK